MKKTIFLVLLFISTIMWSQTVPKQSRLAITQNVKQNTATRVVVQDSITKELNWVLKSSIVQPTPTLQQTLDTQNTSTTPAVFSGNSNGGPFILAESSGYDTADGFDVRGTITGINKNTNSNSGGYAGTGVYGEGSVGLKGEGVEGESQSGIGVWGNGNEISGIGVLGSGSTGVQANGSNYGVIASGFYGVNATGNDIAVLATGNNIGVYAEGDTGVQANGGNTAVVATGINVGVRGISPYGIGGSFGGGDTGVNAYGDTGVNAYGDTVGVNASGPNIGVNASGDNAGIYANSPNIGVEASGGYAGIYAYSPNIGVYAEGNTGVYAQGNTGNAGTFNIPTSNTSNIVEFRKEAVPQAFITHDGKYTGNSFVKTGGTSSQFLKADGSIDSNTYALDSNLVHKTGNEIINGVKTFNVDGVFSTGRIVFNSTYSGAGDPSNSPIVINQNGNSGTYGQYVNVGSAGAGLKINSNNSVGDLIVFSDNSQELGKVTSLGVLHLKGANFSGSVVVPNATIANQAVNLGQVQTTLRPYKVYTALLTQSGTSAPTAIVLENTLGGTVVWSYFNIGSYIGTLTGAFNTTKTTVQITRGNPSITPFTTNMAGQCLGNNSFGITTFSTTSYVDSQLSNCTLEVRVYN